MEYVEMLKDAGMFAAMRDIVRMPGGSPDWFAASAFKVRHESRACRFQTDGSGPFAQT
jgi:hypothetical protein